MNSPRTPSTVSWQRFREALVESQRGIEISDNNAQAAVKKAEGEKKAGILAAEGRAKTVEIEADAQAHKVKTEGEAEAGITKLKGEAEGVAIRAKGEAQAAAYKLSQEALGPDYARLQIIEAIAKNNLKIIPGGSIINQFLGIEMIEKLTGKPFISSVTQIQSPSETPTEETTVEE